jgi:hypothetical protein
MSIHCGNLPHSIKELQQSKGASTLLMLVWLSMLASNLDDMTSHETSNLKTIASKLKYDYSLYTLRVNIRILTRRSLASNWSSVDEDLRAQVKARRVSRRARVMWTRLYICYLKFLRGSNASDLTISMGSAFLKCLSVECNTEIRRTLMNASVQHCKTMQFSSILLYV